MIMAEVALGILEFASEIITQYTGIILSINKLKSLYNEVYYLKA
jgi:hypothetical protein